MEEKKWKKSKNFSNVCGVCEGDKMIQDDKGDEAIKCPNCGGTGKLYDSDGIRTEE